jgi:hypothetical protein
MLCTSLLSCATSSQPHQPEEKLCNIIPDPSTGGEVVQHHPSPINQRRSCATSSQTHQPEEKLCNIIPAPSTRGEVVQLHPRPGNRRRLCNFTRLKNYEMMFMVDVSTATGMTPRKMLHNFIQAPSPEEIVQLHPTHQPEEVVQLHPRPINRRRLCNFIPRNTRQTHQPEEVVQLHPKKHSSFFTLMYMLTIPLHAMY